MYHTEIIQCKCRADAYRMDIRYANSTYIPSDDLNRKRTHTHTNARQSTHTRTNIYTLSIPASATHHTINSGAKYLACSSMFLFVVYLYLYTNNNKSSKTHRH